MNRSFRFLGALLAALALAACDGLSAPNLAEPTPGQASTATRAQIRVVLTLGQSAPLREPGASLTFDALPSDTRCPVGMSCPWRGVAQTRFTLRTADGTPYPITLAIPSGPPGERPLEDASWAVAGGYVVYLTRLQPYPGWPPDGGMETTATVVVAPCRDRCFETWPPR